MIQTDRRQENTTDYRLVIKSDCIISLLQPRIGAMYSLPDNVDKLFLAVFASRSFAACRSFSISSLASLSVSALAFASASALNFADSSA